MKIEDNTGKGFGLKVDKSNRAHVAAVSKSEQHVVSLDDNRAYQVSHVASIAASEVNILSIKNTSDTRDLVLSYIRCQANAGATQTAGDYFRILIGGSRSSGGTTLTATNMYSGSAITAEANIFGHTAGSAISVSGFTEIDRTYTVINMNSYNKEGALILPKNQELLISYVGSTASGDAWCRCSFYYDTGGNGSE